MADNITGLTVGLDTDRAIENAKKLEDALLSLDNIVKGINTNAKGAIGSLESGFGSLANTLNKTNIAAEATSQKINSIGKDGGNQPPQSLMQLQDILKVIPNTMDSVKSSYKDLTTLVSTEGIKAFTAEEQAQIKEYINNLSKVQNEYKDFIALTKNQKVKFDTPDAVSNFAGQARGIKGYTDSINQLKYARQQLTGTETNYDAVLKRLNVEINRLDKEQKKALRSGIELDTQKKKLINTADQLTRRFALIFSVSQIKGYFSKLVEVRGEFELQNKALAAIIQNKNAADKLFGQITELSVKSPFQLKELVTYTKQLAAYRIETEKLYDTTKMLGDISSGVGVSMDRLILAFGQVKAANYLRGQELRQFSEAGINILGELADKFSEVQGRVISTGEVFEMVSNRMVTFKDVEEVFKSMTSAGGIFYNMQELQADTLKGKVSNLTDAIDIMLNKIGTEQESTLKGTVDAVRYLVDNYEVLIGIIKALIAAYGIYRLNLLLTKKTLIELAVTQQIIASDQVKSLSILQLLTIGWRSFTSGVKSASVAMKTFVANNAWLLAVSLAISGIYKLISASNEHDEQLKEIAKKYDDLFKQVKDISVDFKINSDSADIEKQKSNLKQLITFAEKELNFKVKIDWSQINANNIEEQFRLAKEQIKEVNYFIEDFYKKLQESTEWTLQDDIFEDLEELGKSSNELYKYFDKNIKGIIYDLTQMGDAISDNQKKSLELLQKPRQDNPKLKGYETELEYLTRLSDGYKLLMKDYSDYSKKAFAANKSKERESYFALSQSEYEKIKGLGVDILKLNNLTREWNKDLSNAKNEVDDIVKSLKFTKNISKADKTILLKATIESISSEKAWNDLTKQQIYKWIEEEHDIKFNISPLLPEEKQLSIWQQNLQDWANKNTPELKFKVGVDKSDGDVLSDINSLYNQENQALQQKIESNKILKVYSNQEIIDATKKVNLYDQLRRAAGYADKGKDLQAERVKEQIKLIKEAQAQYEKLRKQHDAPTAKAKTTDMFAPKFAEYEIDFEVDISDLDATFETMLTNLGKKYGKNVSEAAKNTIKEEQFKIALDAQVNTKFLDDVKVQMAKAFENFELTLELESSGVPADLIKSIFPDDYTSQEDLFRETQKAIADLRQKGGIEAIKDAEELEKKLTDIKLQQNKDAAKIYVDALRQSSDYEAQRVEIARKAQEEIKKVIASTMPEPDKKATVERIEATQKQDITKVNLEEFKASDWWTMAFEDLDRVATSSLNTVLVKMEEFKRVSKDTMSTTDFKTLTDAMQKVREQVEGRGNPFSLMAAGIREMKAANKEYELSLESLTITQQGANAAQDEVNRLSNNGSYVNISDKDAYIKAENELSKASNKLSKAQLDVAKSSNKAKSGQDKFIKGLSKSRDVVMDVGSAASDLAGVFDDELASSISGVLGLFDTVVNAVTDISDVVYGVGEATKVAGKATEATISGIETASIILIAISAALKIATAIANLFIGNRNEEQKKIIKESEQNINSLEKSYDKLSRAVDQYMNGLSGSAIQNTINSYKEQEVQLRKQIALYTQLNNSPMFKGKYTKLIESYSKSYDKVTKSLNKLTSGEELNEISLKKQQIENLELQRIELSRMIQAMEAMKVKKKDREEHEADLAEMKDDYVQLGYQIEDSVADISNSILDMDLGSASEDFANAWIDAAASGEDAMAALSDSFDSLIKNMIVKSLATKIVQKRLKELWEAVDKATDDDVITEKEVADMISLKDKIIGGINSDLESLRPLLEQLGTGKIDETLSGLQKGIQGITEETAGALEALLNTIVYEMFRSGAAIEGRLLYICDTLAISNSLASRSLTELSGMHSLIKEIRAWQNGITKAGHPQGGDGIKTWIS